MTMNIRIKIFNFFLAFFLLLALCTIETEAKGGGRGGGGRGGGSRGGGRGGGGELITLLFNTLSWSHSSVSVFIFGGGGGGGGGGGIPTWLLVLIVVVIVLCCICACIYYSDEDTSFSDEATTPCYLCQARIKDTPWNDGSHRKECAQRNRSFLATLPMPFAVNCPKCEKLLRQWPERGSFFTCDDSACHVRDQKIVNTGRNRFNCFVCDYDLCITCARRKDNASWTARFGQEQQQQQQQPSAPAPETKIEMNPVDDGAAAAASGGWTYPTDEPILPYSIHPKEPPPSYNESQKT